MFEPFKIKSPRKTISELRKSLTITQDMSTNEQNAAASCLPNPASELFHEGYLTKKGKIRRNWKRRWFVLDNGILHYYQAKPNPRTSGSGPVYASVKEIGSIDIRGCSFGPTSFIGKKYAHSIQFITQDRTYFLFADSNEEFEDWKTKLSLNGAKWDEAITRLSDIAHDDEDHLGFSQFSIQEQNDDSSKRISRINLISRETALRNSGNFDNSVNNSLSPRSIMESQQKSDDSPSPTPSTTTTATTTTTDNSLKLTGSETLFDIYLMFRNSGSERDLAKVKLFLSQRFQQTLANLETKFLRNKESELSSIDSESNNNNNNHNDTIQKYSAVEEQFWTFFDYPPARTLTVVSEHLKPTPIVQKENDDSSFVKYSPQNAVLTVATVGMTGMITFVREGGWKIESEDWQPMSMDNSSKQLMQTQNRTEQLTEVV